VPPTATVIDRDAITHLQVQRAINDAGGFGFWRYLTTRAHDATPWLPYLRRGFTAGMAGTGPVALSRPVVDRAMGELPPVRNRVAYHEPLLSTDLAARRSDVVLLLDMIDPDLSRHVQRHSTWSTARPAAHDGTVQRHADSVVDLGRRAGKEPADLTVLYSTRCHGRF